MILCSIHYIIFTNVFPLNFYPSTQESSLYFTNEMRFCKEIKFITLVKINSIFKCVANYNLEQKLKSINYIFKVIISNELTCCLKLSLLPFALLIIMNIILMRKF